MPFYEFSSVTLHSSLSNLIKLLYREICVIAPRLVRIELALFIFIVEFISGGDTFI